MSGTTNAVPPHWPREIQRLAALQRPPLGSGHQALGRALTVLLACCAAVSLAKVMMDFYGVALFAGGTGDPKAIVAANGVNLVVMDLALLALRDLAVIATGIATITWLYLAYGSREADPAHLPLERWWTIGGWLIPFISLRRPLTLMQDLYSATTGALAIPGARVRCPQQFRWWWACFLLGNFLTNPLLAIGSSLTTSGRQRAITVDLIGHLLLIAASGLFVAVLGSITSQIAKRNRESTATARKTRVR